MKTFKPFQNKNFRKQVRPADIEYLNEITLLEQIGLPAAFVTDAFFVKQDDYIVRIRHKSILWLQADGNYTEVYTSEREKPILLVHNIGKVEELLPQRYFVRISRSAVINTHFIDRICGNALYIRNKSFKIDKGNYRKICDSMPISKAVRFPSLVGSP